jgi:hypothetical protein
MEYQSFGPDSKILVSESLLDQSPIGRTQTAKKRRVRFGRPRKLALDQGEFARSLVSEGKSVRDFDQYLFEELFVLLRMPYRIVPAERVVTFAGTPGVTHYNLEAASSGAPTGLEDQIRHLTTAEREVGWEQRLPPHSR